MSYPNVYSTPAVNVVPPAGMIRIENVLPFQNRLS